MSRSDWPDARYVKIVYQRLRFAAASDRSLTDIETRRVIVGWW